MRDKKVDVLKTLGLLLIIMAHIPGVPDNMMYLRSFDVVMMVFLSGMSFQFSLHRYQELSGNFKYKEYAINRFKRLVVPTWTYISILFLSMYVVTLVLNIEFPYSIKTIISSYVLFHGIGYIWIMRVYFISSLLYPVALYIYNQIKKMSIYIIIPLIFGFFVTQYYLVNIVNNPTDMYIRIFFEEIFLQTTGYFIVSLMSFIWMGSDKSDRRILIAVLTTIYMIVGYIYDFNMLAMDKYPPGPYYLSYGLLVTMVLLFLPQIKVGMLQSSLDYIARNSLEIYFWHTFFIIGISFFNINYNWILLYVIVLLLSIVTTYLQKLIIPNLFFLK